LSFSIYRREIETKTLRLLKLVRAALIYLSLSINVEELCSLKKRDPGDVVPGIQMGVLEDEWKI
jgi:hypothetical protein